MGSLPITVQLRGSWKETKDYFSGGYFFLEMLTLFGGNAKVAVKHSDPFLEGDRI